MSLKIDASNEIPFLPQHKDEQVIKKDAAAQIGISSYESKDVGSNWGEEIWRPDGVKKFLHPILGDRWGRVQTASASDDYCKTKDHTKTAVPPIFEKSTETEKPCPHDKAPHDKEAPPPHDKAPT